MSSMPTLARHYFTREQAPERQEGRHLRLAEYTKPRFGLPIIVEKALLVKREHPTELLGINSCDRDRALRLELDLIFTLLRDSIWQPSLGKSAQQWERVGRKLYDSSSPVEHGIHGGLLEFKHLRQLRQPQILGSAEPQGHCVRGVHLVRAEFRVRGGACGNGAGQRIVAAATPRIGPGTEEAGG